MSGYISFPCLKVRQPIGEFYIGAISAEDIKKISWADVRRIEDRDLEKYLGIQRPLSLSRVKELNTYVNLVDASFPTSIILSISSQDIVFDEKKNIMSVKDDDKVAKIIDGQHRIAGLETYGGNEFALNVTIFIDMDIEDQAIIFSTINLKQAKVTKSLAYDLFDYAKQRSPQKTCHNIARLLNNMSESPFFHRIKILGVASGGENETITQSTFIECIMPYISANPMEDRDLIKRGKKLKKVTDLDEKRFFYRNYFIDNKDELIGNNIFDYFNSIQKKWPKAWNSQERGIILSRSTGFRAFVKLLKDIYNSNQTKNLCTFQYFNVLMNKVKLNENDFNTDNFKPGTSGESVLYKQLKNDMGF